jgi:hypothetical protein
VTDVDSTSASALLAVGIEEDIARLDVAMEQIVLE